MKNLIIIGTSTTARRVYGFVKKYNLFNVIGFAVNREYIKDNMFLELPVYAIEDLENIIDKANDKLFVAIQWNRLNAERRDIYSALKSEGYQFANLISPTALVYSEIEGENCWISDYSIIYNDIKIGNNTFIKEQAIVGDNVTIGDHCFIGLHAVIGGSSIIGEQSFIGLNAVVFDSTTIGSKCIVGACSAVKRNMPDCSKCQTSSNAMVFKQYTEDVVESKLMFSKNVRE